MNKSGLHHVGLDHDTSRRSDVLSVVLKVSERCNIACTYCYFFFSGDESYKQHPATVPVKTVSALCDFLKDSARNGVRDIRVGFHGGEPLLLKKDRFVALCDALGAALEGECRLTLVVQTNAMLVDDEWIDIFQRYKVRIGVSFDGPQEVHDIARLDKKGRGTYQATEDGWFRLMKAASEGRISEPGVLCVVDPRYSGARIFSHFVNRLGARGINFLLPDLSHDSPELTPEVVDLCGRYLVDVFDAWRAYGNSGVAIRYVSEVFGPLLNDDLCLQSLKAKNSPYSQIIISSNGDVCPDDTLRGLNSKFRETGLSVFDTKIDRVWSSDLWSEMADSNERPPAKCGSCKWWSLCKGGTMHHRYSESEGFNNPSVFCDALLMTYEHIHRELVKTGFDAAAMHDRITSRPKERAEAA